MNSSSSKKDDMISSLKTQEERIDARRRRAETRIRLEKEEAEGKTKRRTEQPQEISLSQKQVGASTAVLERMRDETWDDITGIRVRFDEQENQRRIVEENNRLDRYEALQIEAVTSGRKNAAIEMRWSELLSMDIPQELHEQLQKQKNACTQIIEGKDRRIRDFLTELKNKDEEYVRTLKQQSGDITSLITKMREQYHAMRRGYDQQLEEIEKAFEQERRELIDSNKHEIEELFEKRKQMEEIEFLEERQKRERKFQQEIEELRTRDSDEYNQCKIKMEQSIQEFEQHHERMIATYQLNQTKLEYNNEVLAERYKEHSVIQSHYKNRLSKLRGTHSKLVERYTDLDKGYKEKNTQLTGEYKRLTRQFKDLQEKFQHFEQADERKWREVWEMNEQEARALISKIQDADRILHEQQLGLDWFLPSGEQLMQEVDTLSESGTATGKSTALDSGDGSDRASSGRYPPSKVKKVLDVVKEETQFLLEIKVREQMAQLPAEQQDVLQLDALLRYIGVESQEDVDLLVSVFFRGQEDDDETMLIDADEVLDLLRDFIEEKENLNIAAEAAPDKKKKSSRTMVGSESEQERRARVRKEYKRFWERLSHVIPDIHFRVWKALDTFLKQYYGLLQNRSKAIDDAVAMQRQNEELKQLLDQYLGSKVNEELHVPPTHVIRVTGVQ